MTNPYSMGVYPMQQGMYPSPQSGIQTQPIEPYSNKGSGFSAIGTGTLGAVTGGVIGGVKYRHPIGKNGDVSDSFVDAIYKRNLKKNCSDELQKYSKQLNKAISKIKKITTAESLKTFLKDNRNLIESPNASIDFDVMVDTLDKNNVKDVKTAVAKRLDSAMEMEKVPIKNAIKMAWDPQSKKFVDTPEFKDKDLFKMIKNTKTLSQWKKIGKYGAIGGIGTAALCTIYNLFMSPKRHV